MQRRRRSPSRGRHVRRSSIFFTACPCAAALSVVIAAVTLGGGAGRRAAALAGAAGQAQAGPPLAWPRLVRSAVGGGAFGSGRRHASLGSAAAGIAVVRGAAKPGAAGATAGERPPELGANPSGSARVSPEAQGAASGAARRSQKKKASTRSGEEASNGARRSHTLQGRLAEASTTQALFRLVTDEVLESPKVPALATTFVKLSEFNDETKAFAGNKDALASLVNLTAHSLETPWRTFPAFQLYASLAALVDVMPHAARRLAPLAVKSVYDADAGTLHDIKGNPVVILWAVAVLSGHGDLSPGELDIILPGLVRQVDKNDRKTKGTLALFFEAYALLRDRPELECLAAERVALARTKVKTMPLDAVAKVVWGLAHTAPDDIILDRVVQRVKTAKSPQLDAAVPSLPKIACAFAIMQGEGSWDAAVQRAIARTIVGRRQSAAELSDWSVCAGLWAYEDVRDQKLVQTVFAVEAKRRRLSEDQVYASPLGQEKWLA